MRPRTELEKRVVELNATLKENKTYKYDDGCVIKHCYPHQMTRINKNTLHCLDCGGDFEYVGKDKVRCPHCGNILELTDGKKRVWKRKFWYNRMEQCKEFQLIRQYQVRCKTGEAPEYLECVRVFVSEKGTMIICSLKKAPMCYYSDVYNSWSSIELRNTDYHESWCYHIQSLTPFLKKRGMNENQHWSCPTLVKLLMNNNEFESAYKLGFLGMCNLMLESKRYSYHDTHNWKAINVAMKIAKRHNYHALKNERECQLWADMIDFMAMVGADIHNPKYVCPDNLGETHNHFMKEANFDGFEKGDKAKYNNLMKKRADNPDKEKAYNDKIRSFYYDLDFKVKNISINVVKSVDEMMHEGLQMHHCVGGYWLSHPNSLIFSICDEYGKVATAELRLDDYKVPQVYGDHDKESPYRELVTKFLTNNSDIVKADKNYRMSLQKSNKIQTSL